MDEAIAQVDPETALGVGLKVDVTALPSSVIAAIRADQLDLKNPAVTIELLRLNAVLGVKGRVNEAGQLTSIGVTCALCHSTVDDSLIEGIGRRLDGWANTDLDVGKIVALSPALDEAAEGGIPRVGAWDVRPQASRVRRHQHHSAQQPVAAGCHPWRSTA